jgi:hypothetical protein
MAKAMRLSLGGSVKTGVAEPDVAGVPDVGRRLERIPVVVRCMEADSADSSSSPSILIVIALAAAAKRLLTKTWDETDNV